MAEREGRPTKYSQEMLEKTREYIDSCEDENIQKVKQSNSEKGYDVYENKLKVKVPTIEGLAFYLKISRSTLYLWKEENKEFSDIIEELQQKQADRLLNNGLSGDYNPTIAKVLLTKHGYVDRQDIQQETRVTGKIANINAKEATEEEIDSFLLGELS